MNYKMKSTIFTVLSLFMFTTLSWGQFSVEAGLSLPMGDYADDDGGSAALGFNVRGGWDKLLNENLGIATGVIIGGNSFDEDISGVDVSGWSYFVLEVGLLVQASEQFNIKGMLVRAGGASPEIKSGSQVLLTSASAGAFGFDLRLEYEISKIYISANFLSFAPEFQFTDGISIVEDKQSMSTIGIGVGYKF